MISSKFKASPVWEASAFALHPPDDGIAQKKTNIFHESWQSKSPCAAQQNALAFRY
jgi:hypothetical protein